MPISRNSVQASRRVLVVDDHLDTVQSMATLLKMYGHHVEFAINARAAIDIARKFEPEVVFIDIALPDCRGEELARQLRTLLGLSGTRLIALSSRSDDEIRKSACDAGCAEFHTKPLDAGMLETLLARI